MNNVPDTQVLFESTTQSKGVLLTVAVSLFNYQDEIEECLASVANQTHERIELIVVDDASTDKSAATAQSWLSANAARFDRVCLLQHEANRGLPAARNTAFKAARADWVFVLDADNLLYPRALTRLLEAIQDSGAAVAFSQLVLFGSTTGLGEANIWRYEGLRWGNYIDAMALVARSAWQEVGGYSAFDYGWEDFDLWCKFIEAGLQGVFVPELLCRYRVHPDSMLRTETEVEKARLIHMVMSAHPWVDVRP